MFPTLNSGLNSNYMFNTRAEVVKPRPKQGRDHYVSKAKTNKQKQSKAADIFSKIALVGATAILVYKGHGKIKKTAGQHKINKEALKFDLGGVWHFTKNVFKDIFAFFKKQATKAPKSAGASTPLLLK